MGRRPLRRRSPGFQEADLRDALRPRQRRVCAVRKLLYRIALSGEPAARLAGRKFAVVDQLPVASCQYKIGRDGLWQPEAGNWVLGTFSESETRAVSYSRAPLGRSHPPCAGGIFVR